MKKVIAILTFVALFGAVASASVLDWSSVAWPAGTLSNTYTVDGVDVTLAFTGSTDNILTSHSMTTNTGDPLPTDLHEWATEGTLVGRKL